MPSSMGNFQRASIGYTFTAENHATLKSGLRDQGRLIVKKSREGKAHIRNYGPSGRSGALSRITRIAGYNFTVSRRKPARFSESEPGKRISRRATGYASIQTTPRAIKLTYAPQMHEPIKLSESDNVSVGNEESGCRK